MTQEEIIKKGNEKYPQDIIEIINDDNSITREDVNFKVRKAYIQGLIDNNVNLPSGLDEAAIDAAQLDMQDRQIMEATNDERQRYSRIFRRGFKAGAEWMVEQGLVSEGIIINQMPGEDTMIELNEYIDNLEDCEEVIVNIRKKQ